MYSLEYLNEFRWRWKNVVMLVEELRKSIISRGESIRSLRNDKSPPFSFRTPHSWAVVWSSTRGKWFLEAYGSTMYTWNIAGFADISETTHRSLWAKRTLGTLGTFEMRRLRLPSFFIWREECGLWIGVLIFRHKLRCNRQLLMSIIL